MNKTETNNAIANNLNSNTNDNTNKNNQTNPPLIGMAQIILAAMCWGSLGIFSTYLGNLGFSGSQLTALRVVTAAIIVMILLPSLWSSLKALTPRQWGILSLQSLIGVLGMTACYFFAVLYAGVAMAVALLYTAPVFSLIFAHFLLGEKMTKQSTILSLIAVIGVACTMAGDGFSINIGVVIGLLSGVCYSMYGILGKKAMHDAHSPQLIFFTSVVISAVALLFLPSTYSTYQQIFEMPMQSWLYVFGMSVVGTIMPFWLYMRALETLPATKASIFTIFEPLTAILLSVVMLNQGLNLVQGIGVMLIIVTALLNGVLGARVARRPTVFHDEYVD